MFVENYRAGQKWIPGRIIKSTGPLSFLVELENGQQRRCHSDHLGHKFLDASGSERSQVTSEESLVAPFSTTAVPEATSAVDSSDTCPPVPTQSPSSTSVTAQSATHRYPLRNRKQREWFEPRF